MNNTLYILDGYGLIYRAYFAFISRPLTDREGNNVSAVHGFFRALFSLMRNNGAKDLAVAMDPIGPTFRHEMYPEYKATRDAAPEDLHAQVPLIEEILGKLGIPVIRMDGFEADDVMGSVAALCCKEKRECRLVTSDKDMMQLVGGCVKLLRPEKGGGYREMGSEEVFEDKGVRPEQMIDYLALIGDASDNIPGVAGIGPKTASALLAEWGDLDGLYANLDSAAKGARLEKLRGGKETAYFSRELVTIKTDLDVKKALAAAGGSFAGAGGDYYAAAQLFREKDMKSLAAEAEAFAVKAGGRGTAADEAADKRGGMDSGDGAGGSAGGGRTAGADESRGVPAESGAAGIGRAASDESGEAISAAASGVTYKALLKKDDLEEWGANIREAGAVALDTETTSLDAMRADLVGISLSVKAGEAAWIPVKRPDGPCLEAQIVLEWLADLLGGGDVRIIGQNFKYDYKVLRRAGCAVPPAWFDTMIAAWMIDASSPVGMDALAERYLGLKTVKFKDVVSKGGTFADVPLDDAVRYAAEDADITWRLFEVLSPMLEQDKARLALFRGMEMPLLPVLAGMEMEGIGLDIFELEAYGEELGRGIRNVEKEIYELCGKEFNIASPKQLQQILFEERGLTPGKKTKTGFSTDNTVLSDLAGEDPVPEKVLVYRSLTKLKSTYVDVLPTLVHPQDGRVHTSFLQTGAATGRLASNNPNLQNIPVRDENGRRIRAAFKARPGCLFVSADYSQVELVVLAHMSGDQALSAAFRDGVDVHARTAGLLFGVGDGDVTGAQRRMAKAVNFGVMYGMSAFRLSNELGIPRKEAKHFIDAYFTTYSAIRSFVESAVAEAEEAGGVRTLYGRFRPLPGINSRNRVEKAAAERAAVNSRIQGTAADIMKAAMIDVASGLEARYPAAKMLLQVHDELLLEVPEGEAEAVASFLKETMEGAVELSVPLRVGVEIAPSWGDLH